VPIGISHTCSHTCLTGRLIFLHNSLVIGGMRDGVMFPFFIAFFSSPLQYHLSRNGERQETDEAWTARLRDTDVRTEHTENTNLLHNQRYTCVQLIMMTDDKQERVAEFASHVSCVRIVQRNARTDRLIVKLH
jgi:hypothetical protein